MPIYKKPVLAEIFSEITLEQGSLDDSQYFDLVPIFKEKGFTNVEMGKSFSTPTDANQAEIALVPRVRCWDSTKTRLVQVARDLLVVNLVGNYSGWPGFQNLFEIGFNALTSVISKEKIRSISLHTIDKWKVPASDFTFSKYLNAGGKRIPAWYSDVKDPCDINLGRGFLNRDGYNKKLNIALRRSEEGYEFRITSEFHQAVKKGQVINELLGRLHDESNESFESIITDITREQVMGGAL